MSSHDDELELEVRWREAKRNDRPMTSVVRLALEEYLSKQETK